MVDAVLRRPAVLRVDDERRREADAQLVVVDEGVLLELGIKPLLEPCKRKREAVATDIPGMRSFGGRVCSNTRGLFLSWGVPLQVSSGEGFAC